MGYTEKTDSNTQIEEIKRQEHKLENDQEMVRVSENQASINVTLSLSALTIARTDQLSIERQIPPSMLHDDNYY